MFSKCFLRADCRSFSDCIGFGFLVVLGALVDCAGGVLFWLLLLLLLLLLLVVAIASLAGDSSLDSSWSSSCGDEDSEEDSMSSWSFSESELSSFCGRLFTGRILA